MPTVDHLHLRDASLAQRMETLLDAPAELLLPERLLLYSLVRGLRPARCLEIGSHFGGSATVIVSALDDVGAGSLWCVDPNPLLPADVWAYVSRRATLITGYSPQALADARARAGGPFDFVFVDGDHTHDGVGRDIEGLFDITAPGAHIVCHDSHYWQVASGIDACVARHGERLIDVGTLSTHSTTPTVGADGRTEQWGGLRMLRMRTA